MKRVRWTVAEEGLSTNTRPGGVESVRHAPMTQLGSRLKSQPQGPRPPSLSAFPARSRHFLANLNLSVTLAIASSALPLSASSSVTPHPTPPPSRGALCSPLLSRSPGTVSFFLALRPAASHWSSPPRHSSVFTPKLRSLRLSSSSITSSNRQVSPVGSLLPLSRLTTTHGSLLIFKRQDTQTHAHAHTQQTLTCVFFLHTLVF